MIGAGAMRLVLLWYLVRHPELVWPDAVGDRVAVVLATAAAPILVYVLAMAAAGLSTTLAVALFFAVPFLYFLLITLLRRGARTRAEAGEFT